MHASLFHTAIANREKSAQEILQAIEPISPGLFSALEDDPDLPKHLLKTILLYIIFAYSKDSPFVVMGIQIAYMRENVKAEVNLPDDLYDAVVKLLNPTVRNITLKYLELQGDRTFRHLIRKYELYEAIMDEQMRQLNSEDDEGKLDTKKLVESSKLMDTLLEDIERLEGEMRKDYAFVFDNFTKIKQEQPDRVQSLGIEGHSLVRQQR